LVAYVFDRILKQGAQEAPARADAARQWYRATARRTAANPQTLIRSDSERFRRIPSIGQMYMFQYDPKYKEVLPYYDRFPLVIPFEESRRSGITRGGGFYGINLHYLPLRLRARLMDALYDTIGTDGDQFQITYNILSRASKLRFFRPCVKQYLFSNVKSRFFYIDPKEWDIALFLPTERFAKSSKSRVHRESIARI
jgi:hypothetical protein